MTTNNTIQGYAFEIARSAVNNGQPHYEATLSPDDLRENGSLSNYTQGTLTYTDNGASLGKPGHQIVTLSLTGRIDHGGESPLVTKYAFTHNPVDGTTDYLRSIQQVTDTDIEQYPITTEPSATHHALNPIQESLSPTSGDLELFAAAVKLVQGQNKL